MPQTIVPLLTPFLSLLVYVTLTLLILLELAFFLWIITVLHTHIHKLKIRRKLWTQRYNEENTPLTPALHTIRRVPPSRTKRLHYWDY